MLTFFPRQSLLSLTIHISFLGTWIATKNLARLVQLAWLLLDTNNVPHLLFQLWICSLCLHCKTKQRKVSRFHKNFMVFQNFLKFMKIEFCWRQILDILIIHKPSLGPCEVPQFFLARSVSPFWRLQTNRHPDRIYIEIIDIKLF